MKDLRTQALKQITAPKGLVKPTVERAFQYIHQVTTVVLDPSLAILRSCIAHPVSKINDRLAMVMMSQRSNNYKIPRPALCLQWSRAA